MNREGVRIRQSMPVKTPSRRRRPQQQRSRLTRDAILEAFVRILEKEGHAACTMRRVTDLAGVGLGCFYDYFPSKHDLLAAYFRDNSRALQQTIRSHLTQWRTSENDTSAPQQRLDKLLQALYQPYASRSLLWKKLALLEPQVTSSPHYARDAGEFIALWVEAGQLLAPTFSMTLLADRARTFHMAIYGSLHYRLVCFPHLQLDQGFLQELQAIGRLLLLEPTNKE